MTSRELLGPNGFQWSPMKTVPRQLCVAVLFRYFPVAEAVKGFTSGRIISQYAVPVQYIPATYTELFTQWNDTDNYSQLIINFDSLSIPSSVGEVLFNMVEIISALDDTTGTEALNETLLLTRVANEVVDGVTYAKYTSSPSMTFAPGHRVSYLAAGGQEYFHGISQTRNNELLLNPAIPGIGIGQMITVNNLNLYSIARFHYDTDIVLPAIGGLSLDVGSVTYRYQLE